MTKQLVKSKIENGIVIEVQEIKEEVLDDEETGIPSKKNVVVKTYPVRGTEDEVDVKKLAVEFATIKWIDEASDLETSAVNPDLKDGFIEGYKAASLKAPKGNQRWFDEGAFSLSDVLKKLIDATNILLHKKDYDGGDYEEMGICVKRAGEIIELLNKPIEQTGFSEHRIGDVVTCEIDEVNQTARIL